MMAVCQLLCVATLLTLLMRGAHSQLDVCGQPPLNTKIVNGEDAPAGSWPWQADLHDSGGHFCGGSLINKEWVMSAAHCFTSNNPAGLTIYLGRQSQEGDNPNEVSRVVSQVIRHPSYNIGVQNDNDIALLKLASAVTFSDYIRPVCLAASGSTFYSGIESWITGWGTIGSGIALPSPQNLQEVEVPVVGNRQCNCNYGVGSITDNMICAGLEAGGKDSCQGDSGGPMVSKQGSRWIQSGIVSFGEGCALPDRPGVYARVSQYQSWINSQITSDRPGFIAFTSSGTDSDLSVTCDGLPPVVPASTTIPATTIPPTVVPAATTTPATTLPPTVVPAATTTPATTLPPTVVPAATTTPTTTIPPTTTPKPLVCGRAPLNTRVGGAALVTTEGLWPWMASLQKNGTHVCGGTLMAADFVMSDASCFSSSPNVSEWTVILGRLKQNGANPSEQTLTVTEITVSSLTGDNNVAVLKLASQPTFSDRIQPICVDTGSATFAAGSACWAVGWGLGEGGEQQDLQEFETSVVDCGNASSSSDSICTGAVTLQQGDAGGPLMCKQGAVWFQTAVLTISESGNQTRGKASSPMVFTKTATFQSFLRSTVGSLLSPASTASPGVDATTTSSAPHTALSFIILLPLTSLSILLSFWY